MKHLTLPDLGEGLKEAELVQWYVQPGQQIVQGTPLLSVETAKALVDIPAPEAGSVQHCYGNAGDVIAVGTVLLDYLAANVSESLPPVHPETPPSVSVVGELSPSGSGYCGDTLIIGRQRPLTDEGYEPLQGLRREMAHAMTHAWRHVARVSIFDEVILHKRKHLLARLLEAVYQACKAEPALNAWLQTHPLARKLHTEVRIGLAMAMPYGLIVPVLPGGPHERQQWEADVELLRQKAEQRTLSIADHSGATITLSSFGMFGGRHATPMVSPPQVAIVGAGRLSPVGKKRHLLPLSLSFDHRCVTGKEAAGFLQHLGEHLRG